MYIYVLRAGVYNLNRFRVTFAREGEAEPYAPLDFSAPAVGMQRSLPVTAYGADHRDRGRHRG